MSEEENVLNQLDSIDLSTVETSYPNLKTGHYHVRVVGCTVEDGKKPGAKNLVIKFALTEATEAVDGRQVNPGFVIMQRVSLTKTFKDDGSPKYDPMPTLAKFREAIFGKATAGTQFMPLEQYIGQELDITVKFDANVVNKVTKEEYGPQSSVTGYVRKA